MARQLRIVCAGAFYHLTSEFKARVAAEALKGEQSILQIAKENNIAPIQVSTWKKELEDHMPTIFDSKNAADQSAEKQERRTSHLERKIGQLLIKKVSLKKSVINWELI
jgi:transposase